MEGSEGGIGGFLKKLRFPGGASQDKTPTRQPPAQPPPEQEQERLRKAQERYENENKRLRTQLSLEIPQIASAEIDYRKEIEILEAGVKAREIFGKFYAGVKIKNTVAVQADSNDFNSYGDTQAIAYNPTMGTGEREFSPPYITEGTLRIPCKDRETQDIKELRKKHFITYVNKEDGDVLVSYMFLHDHRDQSSRPSGIAAINFLMDKDSAVKLLGLIRRNPDVAEMFLQKAAEGFEADPEKNTPGIKRIRSDEVVLLHLRNFNLDSFNRYRDPYSGNLLPGRLGLGNFEPGVADNLKQEMVANNNRQVERLKYSKPFGVAEPSVIP